MQALRHSLWIGSLLCGCASSMHSASRAPSSLDGADRSDARADTPRPDPEAAGSSSLASSSGAESSAESDRAAMERWARRSRIAMVVGAGMFVTGGVNMAIGLGLQARSRREGGDGDDSLYTAGAPIVGGVVCAAGLVTLLAGVTSLIASKQQLRRSRTAIRVSPLLGGHLRAPRFGLSVEMRF